MTASSICCGFGLPANEHESCFTATMRIWSEGVIPNRQKQLFSQASFAAYNDVGSRRDSSSTTAATRAPSNPLC
jgi:hypothetical protein